jgi:hypothetical protein
MIVMKKTLLVLMIIYSQESHKIVLIHMYWKGNVKKIDYMGKKVINISNILLMEVKIDPLKQLT